MNTIVFYCDVEWDIFNRRELIIEIANQLKSWRVLVINRPAAVIPNLFRRNKFAQFQECYLAPKKESDNLFIIRPISLFHEHIGGLIWNGLGNWLLKKSIERVIVKHGFSIPPQDKLIIWLYEQPQWIIGQIFQKKMKKVIWEIFDDYTLTAQGAPRNMWINCEPKMLSVADQIFTLTDKLSNKYSKFDKPIHTIGNGYPAHLFYPHKIRPLELENIKNIVMYLGVIRDWIDFDLVDTLVQNNKDLSFVFIGPVEKNIAPRIESLKQHRNFLHLGKKERSEVPKYMSHADVAIIPYLQTEFTKSVKPIKLYEFLACATPVVTTTTADITPTKGVIYCANAENFLSSIRLAMVENEKSLCLSIASPWTWAKVAKNTINILGIE